MVTDAAPPQVNGVVTTIANTVARLRRLGHQVELITPAEFPTVPVPLYPDIAAAVLPGPRLRRRLEAARAQPEPPCFHIFTEGPLGLAARNYLVGQRLAFTTSYHTDFPEYGKKYLMIPPALTWRALRWFHRPATRVLVSTTGMLEQLKAQGFRRLALWGRGIDPEIFIERPALAPPRFLYAGRVAREKGVEDFLKLDLPGKKIVAGDGPLLSALQRRYPAAVFLGRLDPRRLAQAMGEAAVLVFPSRTDTFGIVMAEANSCGTPVAAYPVRGPLDVIEPGITGFLCDDLADAARRCLALDRVQVAARARNRFSWQHSTEQFLANLCTARPLCPAIAVR